MISVVIPLYNKEAIIKKSIESVLTQDYDDFEVIVVNDGSTDNSVEIVKAIHDPRITLIEQENGGPSKARNTGVKNAKGEWILFLDADDELLPGALKHFAELVKAHKNIEMFMCPFVINDGKKRYVEIEYCDRQIGNVYKEHALKRISPHTGSVLMNKNVMLNNLYNEEIRRYEDLEQILRVYKKVEVYTSSHPVVVVNTEFISASKPRKIIKEDFIGHLSILGKRFWEKMLIYGFYLEERPLYPTECRRLYPMWYLRYDLLLIYKIIMKFKMYL